MSLLPELRVLCHLLSVTPLLQLPSITPILQRYIVSCRSCLSAAEPSSHRDASESAVLVHKLKTKISSLLSSKASEGRFVAAILIKSVVEVGGWETLRGVEPWLRGLLAILTKAERDVVKKMCILAVTKIYILTHEYPSLVRELATPTLPDFISSCLDIISPMSPRRGTSASLSVMESVFDALSALLPRHSAIFRPFTIRIRTLCCPCIAPTLCDKRVVRLSLCSSARRLVVLTYQTTPKSGGGEEWSKGIREVIAQAHSTVDLVYRSVLEDWEATVGHLSTPVDISQELAGGGKTEADLPTWTGIDAGIERLIGLLGFLEEHFKYETPFMVAVPLTQINDLISRLLSVVAPSNSTSGYGTVRTNPSVERNEREGLFSSLPALHTAALHTLIVLHDRLGAHLTPLVNGALEHVSHIFMIGRTDDGKLRTVAYSLVALLLMNNGTNLSKIAVKNMFPILQSCVEDVINTQNVDAKVSASVSHRTKVNELNSQDGRTISTREESELTVAASKLLPLFLSHLPPEHQSEKIRVLLERTAILARNRDTIVASLMNYRLNSTTVTRSSSLLPYLIRAFPGDKVGELILRPRAHPIRTKEPATLTHEQIVAHDEIMMDASVMHNALDPYDLGEVSTFHHETISSTGLLPRVDDSPPLGEEKLLKIDATSQKVASTKASPWEALEATVNERSLPNSAPKEPQLSGGTTDQNFSRAKGIKIQNPMSSNEPQSVVLAHAVDAIDSADESDASVHLHMELSDSDDSIML